MGLIIRYTRANNRVKTDTGVDLPSMVCAHFTGIVASS